MNTKPPFLTLVGSAARTATGNGDTLDLLALGGWQGDYVPSLRLQVDVTAISGTTPSLTVLIEDSIDGVNWNTVGTFTAMTTVSRQVVLIGQRGDAQPAGFAWPCNFRRMRARWTISGTTPNITFSVKGALL